MLLLNYIVRDHDTDNFQRRKDKLADITNELNKKWGEKYSRTAYKRSVL